MTHQLGLDVVYEKLVLLQHFAYGSERYCAVRLPGSEQDQGGGAMDEYWSWVKGIVSSYLLECAVRIRILQDTVKDGADAKAMADLDAATCADSRLGTIVSGDFPVSVRETCNKIIHARKAVPEFAKAIDAGVEFKYWSGDYRLSGTKDQEPWELILHVGSWAHAVAKFLDAADAADLTVYVGQDWY